LEEDFCPFQQLPGDLSEIAVHGERFVRGFLHGGVAEEGPLAKGLNCFCDLIFHLLTSNWPALGALRKKSLKQQTEAKSRN